MTTWAIANEPKDYTHTYREINKQRDRGAGIIAAAVLQDILLEAIKSRLDRGTPIEPNLFKQGGALGSFGTQIDLGFLMGLYPETIRKSLHIVRVIRNDFAHNVHPVSFRSQRDNCAKLRLNKVEARKLNSMFVEMVKSQTEEPVTLGFTRSSTNPRTQYINFVQAMTLFLSIMAALGQTERWAKRPGRAPQPSLGKSKRRPALGS